eukprot:403174_1
MAPWWQYHKTICTLSLTAAFLVFNWTNYAKECLEVIFQGIREAVQYVATSCGNFAKDRPVRFLCQFVVLYLCIALFQGYPPFPYHETFKEPPVICEGVHSFLKDHQIDSRWVSKSLPVGSVLTLDCPFPLGKDASIEVTCVERVAGSEPLDTASLDGKSVDKASMGDKSVDKVSIGDKSVEKASMGDKSVDKASMGDKPVDKASTGDKSVDSAPGKSGDKSANATDVSGVSLDDSGVPMFMDPELSIALIKCSPFTIKGFAFEFEDSAPIDANDAKDSSSRTSGPGLIPVLSVFVAMFLGFAL